MLRIPTSEDVAVGCSVSGARRLGQDLVTTRITSLGSRPYNQRGLALGFLVGEVSGSTASSGGVFGKHSGVSAVVEGTCSVPTVGVGTDLAIASAGR